MAVTITGSDVTTTTVNGGSPTHAGLSAGSVGTYSLITWAGSKRFYHNSNYASTSLRYAGTKHGGDIDQLAYYHSTGTPSGTWKCSGNTGATVDRPMHVMMRIA
jgi:hypothetical protein